MDSKDLRAEVEYLDACLRDIAERGLPEEQEAFDAGLELRNEKFEQAEKIEKRAAEVAELRSLAEKPAHIEEGSHRVAPVPGASTRNIWDVEEARNASPTREAFASELRSRAETAIEWSDALDGTSQGGGRYKRDEFKEQATRLMQRGLGQANGDPHGDAVARHWIAFGNPEYRDKFLRALKGDVAAAGDCMAATRAWAGDGTTTGGYAVVPQYDVTLMLINGGTTNPFRQLSRVVQSNSNTWYGLSTGGVTAGWITEATEEGDDTPAVAQPSITIQKASAYLQAS